MELNPFIVLPITGALIGWLTNLIAINFLFRPNKPILGIQGVIPKRKKILAEKIAEASLNFLPKKIESLTKIPFIGNQIINYLKKEISEKVNETDNKEIERIIKQVAKKELRFIETSGAVLGFIIGLIQALILSIN
ncbi:hypothetical protein COU53_02165 [Candidatus Pacearchaeota archaeon CG10_big_fil_rev_8_21_14_0_10_30_48]|nr:MAG: hypothetical protein COU53_02165 [Candidatus Pacearchaeota archaeon CG10_big_fil_rev_8_21_14_0_10_30_48]